MREDLWNDKDLIWPTSHVLGGSYPEFVSIRMRERFGFLVYSGRLRCFVGRLLDLCPVFHPARSTNDTVLRRDIVRVRGLGQCFFLWWNHELGSSALKAVMSDWFSVEVEALHFLTSDNNVATFDESPDSLASTHHLIARPQVGKFFSAFNLFVVSFNVSRV